MKLPNPKIRCCHTCGYTETTLKILDIGFRPEYICEDCYTTQFVALDIPRGQDWSDCTEVIK